MSANSEGIDGFRPGHTSRQESVKTRVAEVYWRPDQESAAIKASTPVQPISTLFRSRSPDHQPGLWEPVGSAAIPYFKESVKPVHSFAR